jgi:hypothetical protein
MYTSDQAVAYNKMRDVKNTARLVVCAVRVLRCECGVELKSGLRDKYLNVGS